LRDFVNTLDREDETDDVATPEALAAWLVDHGLLPASESDLSAGDHARAIEHDFRPLRVQAQRRTLS